jgi:hypothetical protein
VATSFATAMGESFADFKVTVAAGVLTFNGSADQTSETFGKVTDGKLAPIES